MFHFEAMVFTVTCMFEFNMSIKTPYMSEQNNVVLLICWPDVPNVYFYSFIICVMG